MDKQNNFQHKSKNPFPSQSHDKLHQPVYREPQLLFGQSPDLDLALEKRLLNDLRKLPTPTTNTPNTENENRGRNKNDDLVSTMVSRLSKLETLSKKQGEEIKQKDFFISEYSKEINLLKLQNKALKNQIHEMETFLNDYGLVWVGEETDDLNTNINNNEEIVNHDVNQLNLDQHSPLREPPRGVIKTDKYLIDLDLIRRNIIELNVLAGEGTSNFVAQGNSQMRLKNIETLPLTIFKNGFMLQEGPFRPFSIASSMPFINDIMDGYFPYELKDRFPDGVPFYLVDKSTEDYTPPNKPFSGAGVKLNFYENDGADEIPICIPTNVNNSTKSNVNIVSLSSLDHSSASTINKDTFLKRLPVSMIRNGRVIDIRQSVDHFMGTSEMFQNNLKNNGVVIVHTEVLDLLEKGNEDERPPTPRDITTLKIKDETGKILIVKLRFHDSIGTLRKHIDQSRFKEGKNKPYEIRTTFPNQVYSDDTLSLSTAGLTPNATMFLSHKK